MFFQQADIPGQAVDRRIRNKPKDIFEQDSDRGNSRPTNIAWLGMPSRCNLIGGIILPKRMLVIYYEIRQVEVLAELFGSCPGGVFQLKNANDILVVVESDLVRQVLATGSRQSLEDHVVGGRPHAAAPVIPGPAVVRIVG